MDPSRPSSRFTFGENWTAFSHDITDGTVAAAMGSLVALLGRSRLDGATVVDIGCGSGLFSQAFVRLGASRVVALDADPMCVELTARRLREEPHATTQVLQASILDPTLPERIPRSTIAYAWGSLHHTGALWTAIDRCAALVESGGVLVVAIYNRHWTSPAWWLVKHVYNRAGTRLRAAMVSVYEHAGMLYNRWTEREISPERGMDRRHDIRDWLGGLPYEYASIDEVERFARARGWEVLARIPSRGMPGCNEFVLRIGSRS